MTTVETVAEPRGSAWTSPARTILLALIGALLVVAIAVAAIGTALDNGHAQLHAGTAAFVLLLAGLLAWRSAISGLLTAIPAIGLAVLAVPMLIEATGALGYDPVTQARTSELATCTTSAWQSPRWGCSPS
jgi:cell division protein FtsW (lipid II flippase)